MSHRHKLQASRFELKYIISEGCARAICDFIRSHLEPDEYARPELGNAYPISSLYLDTPELTLYRQTLQGLKNRFKLRIRFYDERPESPAFLEIKRRENDVIRKERAAVAREGVRRLLGGSWPHKSHLVGSNGSRHGSCAMQHFCDLCSTIGAQSRIYVSYLREAYVSPHSDQVRVTFDRQLRGSPYRPGEDLRLPPHGTHPNVGGVILELKFTDRFPDWMGDMVRAFDLQRRSMPKYIECTRATGIPTQPPPGLTQGTWQ